MIETSFYFIDIAVGMVCPQQDKSLIAVLTLSIDAKIKLETKQQLIKKSNPRNQNLTHIGIHQLIENRQGETFEKN